VNEDAIQISFLNQISARNTPPDGLVVSMLVSFSGFRQCPNCMDVPVLLDRAQLETQYL
jgi:hypothetical protein